MPKFIYTTLVLSVCLWLGLLVFGGRVPPENLFIIFVFLCFLFAALSVSLSLVLYFTFIRSHRLYTNSKQVYRRSLKWALFFSLGVVGTLGLNAFDLINPLNYGLFLLLYISIYYQIRH